jgi:signal transduction histidine kinase
MISGFCAMLVLMGVLSIDSIRASYDIEARSGQVRRDYLNRERTLRDVRFSLYESGNLLREYALSKHGPGARESYLARLHDMRDHAQATLDACIASLPEEQKIPLRQLVNELNSYWLLTDRIILADVHGRGGLPLGQLALNQRAIVLSLTREVSDLNELELRQAEREISSDFAESRHRLRVVTIFGLCVGLLLAASIVFYVSCLERRAQEKYLESLHSQRELKQLSKRLVDAQEEERQSISRELHDQIGQSLTALIMDLQSLSDSPQPSVALPDRLQKIRLLAEECVKEVRNMALLLRPSMLDDLGLIAALQWQGREVSKRTGLRVGVIADHFADNLPEGHRTCVYRVVQEALHNCVKHANARHVRIIIKEDGNHLTLTIEDDGIGFDPTRQRGMGILGMRERVTRLDGSLFVDSSPGGGTCVCVELPLAPIPQSA